MKTKRTGSGYKVRVWHDKSLTWRQMRGLYETPEVATRAATLVAKTGSRAQAIHLAKKAKGASLTVIFDSKEVGDGNS